MEFFLVLIMHLWFVMGIKKNISFPALFFFVLIIASCKTENRKEYTIPTAEIDSVVRRMSDLMVHDVTNPPLAARFFAYAFLSGYEIVSQNNPSVKSMKGIINGYPSMTKPGIKNYEYHLASLLEAR